MVLTSYYANYLIKLKSVCDKKKMSLVEIGRAGSLPIFKITLNPPLTEIPPATRVVVFSAGIHGDDGHSFYSYNFENKKERVYRDIIKLAGHYFPINNAAEIHNNPAVRGLITNIRRLILDR